MDERHNKPIGKMEMLSHQTIDVIKAITPIVGTHAETITRRFYELMFEGDPEVLAFFNPAHQQSGEQPLALAGAITAYFTHIENPAVLGPAIEVIAQKHCSLNVQPEHYPIVGKHLLAAIQDVLGEGATEEILTAVGEAYEVLADLCIQREREIYQAQAGAVGGWNGFRKFVVERKHPECENITSFYLRPADGGPVRDYLPGQYLTVRVAPPALQTPPRQYSLSDKPEPGRYRISVKRESGMAPDSPDGVLSNFLHDQVQEGDLIDVGPPCGEFTLDPDTVDERPIVFLAGGIGITPLLAMAKSLVNAGVLAPMQFLHAVRNSSVHAFREEVQMMVSDKDFVETLFLYNEPLEGDVETFCCDRVGVVDSDLLREWTPHREADFYFCGPRPFMESIYNSLQELGVDESRIHFEFFGPKQALATSAAS